MTTEPAKQDTKDDQELANALAGLGTPPAPVADDELKFEETPAQGGAVSNPPFAMPDPITPPASDPVSLVPEPVTPVVAPAEPVVVDQPAENPLLDGIKKDALNELRPLVDKLNVSAEEKFDTYLLLLRSTDDTSLIGPAHDAAKEIADEARRAQALLDVIKEIDYLTSQNK